MRLQCIEDGYIGQDVFPEIFQQPCAVPLCDYWKDRYLCDRVLGLISFCFIKVNIFGNKDIKLKEKKGKKKIKTIETVNGSCFDCL